MTESAKEASGKFVICLPENRSTSQPAGLTLTDFNLIYGVNTFKKVCICPTRVYFERRIERPTN
ncbi:hypothetical protein COX03_02615 [Candidatus Woesebacteria bacterium CG22_combo_CG10-13_8_21_14_all_39_10]|uniref:Uncharacterized protein n=1 Tax=Candidatus Woesebacteria bacterium CG22_combo_CG10-13_8_21_14_all_39_10 TaxID=1975059 RepID=A0A2H0BKJ1_9BACT|nr:MAG: hypothetical protein COX03_02615 [Candidatus Woesebacteria bacterium CG22_combo_CG10-13_8_21_14_all_39_10]